MPETILTVGGRTYGGWQAIRIQRGIEQIAGSFELTVTERWSGQGQPWPIRPGERCTVAAAGEVVITGYVDDVQPQFDGSRHAIGISGRDATGDLVDCSAIAGSGQWTGRTLAQICADLCAPFGIAVVTGAEVGPPFASFAIQEGESAFETIERACRYRAILPVSDGQGRLLLTRAGGGRLPGALVQGENLLAASAVLSDRDRHSRYIVKGSAAGSDWSTPEQNAQAQGEAKDPAVTRYRPLIVVAEEGTAADKMTERAKWEASVRLGRGSRATCTVQGWRHGGGLWQPNRRLRVVSPWLQLDAELLIVQATLILDEQGRRSELEVCPPAAFEQHALAEPTPGGGAWT